MRMKVMSLVDVYEGINSVAPYVVTCAVILTFIDIAYQAGAGILPSNPIVWRAFDGHRVFLVWMCVGSYFISRRLGVSSVVALVGLAFPFFSHESMWWITDLVYYLVYHVSFSVWWFLGPFQFAALYTFFMWKRLGLPWPKRFLLMMGAFYIGWFAIGFPVTVNYVYVFPYTGMGNTPYFTALWVSGIEYLSWAVALVGFWATMISQFRAVSIEWESRFHDVAEI